MSDEELGRAWAKKQGATPSKVCTGKWLWYSATHGGYPHFDGFLCVLLDRADEPFYPTESAAYAALGAALRRVVAFAESVKEVTG